VAEKSGHLVVMQPGMELAVPEHYLQTLKPYLNQEVILGLRPEHFSEGVIGTKDKAHNSCKAFVRLVEPLGCEQLIHLEMNDQRFIARIDPRSTIQYGQTLDFQADMESAKFFNPETEERINSSKKGDI
jgi:multiple sugar transport system ATP-binding protein